MPKKGSSSDFFKKIETIHGDTYDFSKSIYKSMKNNMIVICKIHGDFNITPLHLLNGYGCKSCKMDSNIKKTDNFIKKILKNTKHKFKTISYNRNKKYAEVICIKGHPIFKTSLCKLADGENCPECNKTIDIQIIRDRLLKKIENDDKLSQEYKKLDGLEYFEEYLEEPYYKLLYLI